MLNFKNLRKEKNLTQKEFSELINVSMRALSNYENGNTDITLKKLQEIADSLKIDFFKLFEDNPVNPISEVNEPGEVYASEIVLLRKNYELMKAGTLLQDEIIAMLREKLSVATEKLQDCENEKKLLATIKKMD